jgi:hypothetical protein
VHPPAAGLQAFLTAIGAGFDIFYLVEMGAGTHKILLLESDIGPLFTGRLH